MRDGTDGNWSGTRLLEWVVVGAVSLPVVAGFVALGAAVVAGRTLRDVGWLVWDRVAGRTDDAVPTASSDAA